MVEATRQGLITSAQATAVVVRAPPLCWIGLKNSLYLLQAALFVGIQTQLISSIPNAGTTSRGTIPLVNALSLFSYAGFLFNVCASLSAMRLLDYLGEIPEQFWRQSPKNSSSGTRPPPEPNKRYMDFRLLQSYGGNSSMSLTYWQCHASLLLGTYCMFLQIALVAWIKLESVVVFAAVVVCLFFVSLAYPGQIIFVVVREVAKQRLF